MITAAITAVAIGVGLLAGNGFVAWAAGTTTDSCGYNPSAAPKPGGGTVIFDENTVTRTIAFYGTGLSGHLGVFANDESSLFVGNGGQPFQSAGTMTLASGLTQNSTYTSISVTSNPAIASGDSIILKTASGTQTVKTSAAVAASSGANTIPVVSFKAGRTFSAGDSATDTNASLAYGDAEPATFGPGNDVEGRPNAPTLYLTDLTANGTSSTIGDWENGGAAATGTSADKLLGAWANLIANKPLVKNNWNLGPNADTPPAGTTSFNEGYGTEIVWNATSLTPALQPGHKYRVQAITHDDDQNHTSGGGDTGEVCVNIQIPGPPGLTTDPTGATDPNGTHVDTGIAEPINSTIHDTAFLKANAGFPNVTGNVTFHLYFWAAGTEPANPANACVAGHEQTTQGFPNTKALTSTSDPSVATSDGFNTQTSANGLGTYYWQDVYNPNGDPNYVGKTENCGVQSDQMVDARIRETPNEAVNIVGNDHTITIHVETTTNGTSWTAVSGAVVNTSLVNNTAAATYVGSSSCTTGAAGTCTVVITSTTVGSVDVHATSTFSQSGVLGSFTRSTGAHSTGDETTDARKTYINPKTQLVVKDRLIGLDASMNGSVTYTAFGTLADCAAGTNGTAGGTFTVTNGVAPLSNSFTVNPGQTLYFTAHYTGTGGTLDTACTAESATSS